MCSLALNAVNLLPIVAYFVPRPVQFATGVFPTYWPMRALWSGAIGETYGGYLIIEALASVLALLFSGTHDGAQFRARLTWSLLSPLSELKLLREAVRRGSRR